MKTDKPIVNTPELVAYCGLYCGTCSKYKNGKCPGCAANKKASWCKIRSCNIENNYINCSHCTITTPADCKKINNAIGKVFKFIFKTDRIASLQYIKSMGELQYADKMVSLNQMSIKTKQTI